MKAAEASGSRILLRVLLTLLGTTLATVGIVGAWYAEENYRGARAWEKTRRDLESRGEPLDAAHFIPPPVPDDQNLAMAPVFVRLYQYQVDPDTGLLTFGKNPHGAEYETAINMPFGSSVDGPARPASRGDWTTAHALDLGLYQRYYQSRKDFPHSSSQQAAADHILLALTRYRDTLAEVAGAAASRPLSRFPVNWTQRPIWNLSLVHGSMIQSMSVALRLRACASLSLGKTDDALRDVLLGWRLNDAIDQEPTLLTCLVALTGRNILLQPVWEGLASHRWTAAQLVELQARLGEVDTLRSFRRAEQSERALFMVSMREELRRPGGIRALLMVEQGHSPNDEASEGWLGTAGRFFPSGWADNAVAFACEWEQKYTIDPIDISAHRLAPASFQTGETALSRLGLTPTTLLIKFSGPIYESLAVKNARQQAALDEAVTACALARYFLDHQSYPAALAALVPAYLPFVPTDVIDGAPLCYEPTPAGRYRLREVGWNGRDESGKVAWNKEGTRLNDKEGDWVWQYEPLAPGDSKKP